MDDTGDILLPPSAFHITRVPSPTVEHCSPETHPTTNLWDTHQFDKNTPNIIHSECLDPTLNQSSSDKMVSLLSQFTMAQLQLRELQMSLQASKEENIRLQKSRDDAQAEVQHIRAYYSHIEQDLNRAEQTKRVDESLKPPGMTLPITATDELIDKITHLEKMNAQMKSELQLSGVRINSLEAALKLQDKKRVALATGDGTEQERTEDVLHFWRDHVIRLLIQLEQAKVQREHAEGRAQRERVQWDQYQRDLKLELDAMRLRLQANEAALAAEKGRTEFLESELRQKSSRLQTLKTEDENNRKIFRTSLLSTKTALVQLNDRISSFLHDEQPASLPGSATVSVSHLIRRLRQLERRLSFASNRLPLLRIGMTLQRGSLSDHCDVHTQTVDPFGSTTAGTLTMLEMEELLSHAQAEANQCKAERDSALRKLEQGVKSFNERVKAAQDEVRSEVTNLRDLVTILENNLKEKQEDLDKCQLQLISLKSDHSNLQQEATQEQTQLHMQLTDARKQLNKAMVELKRAERRINREADERKTRIAELETAYKSRIETLETALRSFQPNSYKWYAFTGDVAENDKIPDPNPSTAPVDTLTPVQLEALTKSMSELARLAECLKSSECSSGSEAEEAEKNPECIR